MEKYLADPESIAAIVPDYQDSGDISIIIYRDGVKETNPRKVRSVIIKLAKHHCADLVLLKKKAAEIAGKTLYNPIVLGPELVLVPLKIRKPRIPNDNTLAYINLASVKSTTVSAKKPYKSLVALEGGSSVDSLWSTITVLHQFSHARLISSSLQNQLPWTQKNRATSMELTDVAKRLMELLCEIVKGKK